MKRNPSESGTKNLADELVELRGLDPTALRQRWRVLYRTEALSLDRHTDRPALHPILARQDINQGESVPSCQGIGR